MRTVTYSEILSDVKQAGVCRGDVLFIQSALSPMGYVEGGAKTVARALIEAVGPEGTVVAPAFCFSHQIPLLPVIDPASDPSEVGAISEAIRTWPGAKRSIAYRHSFSAVGKYADLICDVDPQFSVFDMDSSFGKLLGLNAKIMLLGVTWANSTTHHFAEYLLQVKYRQVPVRRTLLRGSDGMLSPMTMQDYTPKPGDQGYAGPRDFNRTGRMLEQMGKVTIVPVGNALARVHYMRDLVHLLLDLYPVSKDLFCMDPDTGKLTVLPDGQIVTKEVVDGSGEVETAVWSCVNAEDVFQK